MFERREKWYEGKEYKNEQYFRNISKTILRKIGRGTLTISEMLRLINRNSKLNNCFMLSDGIPKELIHHGRPGSTIDRDYTFYKYAKEYLMNNPSTNTLYINYTGHSGPVAAALSHENIPLFWQMDLSQDSITEDRILGQIQDYSSEIIGNTGKNNTNMGLMLECPHGFENTIPNCLPDAKILLKEGIKKVVVFTEDLFIGYHQKSSENIKGIFNYLKGLSHAGIDIEFVGIDCRDKSQGQSSDFDCTGMKEIISDFTPYLGNFSKITPSVAARYALHDTSISDVNDARSMEELLQKILKERGK